MWGARIGLCLIVLSVCNIANYRNEGTRLPTPLNSPRYTVRWPGHSPRREMAVITKASSEMTSSETRG